MKIFYTSDHALHAPALELHRGAFVPAHEGTHRIDKLVAGLKRAGFHRYTTPPTYDDSAIAAVHTPDYIEFLKTAWARWQASGYSGDVLPMSYPHRPRRAKPPLDIDGAAGYFCSSSDTVITQTSWRALRAVADCAVASADHVLSTGGAAFTLTRPPGHHAGADYMSGYCLLNYAAIAVQRLRGHGAKKVAILDVDFHHGNGTQDIFYDRDDVFFASIHGEPDHHFPYFWGHRDEIGQGAGEGFTANYPLPAGTPYTVWKDALMDALKRITAFGADALVVSLGVDTFELDPISTFKLTIADYPDYGAKIGALNLPTVFIMEGGYGVPEIGDNTASVLSGFMNA